MRLRFLFIASAIIALSTTGCSESDPQNNGSLDYDEIKVNFKDSASALNTDEKVGIFAYCTRGGKENSSMSENSPAQYTITKEGASYILLSATPEDDVMALKTDHNFNFSAIYPYSDAITDVNAIEVAAPAVQNYSVGADYGFYVASRKVTSVISAVDLGLKNIFTALNIYVASDIIDEEGKSHVRSLTIEPVEADKFQGAMSASGSYNLSSKELAMDAESYASKIEIDFGDEGVVLNDAYTKIPITMMPLTVPEGGFNVTIVGMDDVSTSFTIFSKDEVGEQLLAGGSTDFYLSAINDGVVPVTFPVVFPLGFENGEYNFSADKQPRWITESVWVCPLQPQSYATWNKVSDPSSEITQYIERVNSKNAISSPGIKGIWTGDNFEFIIPVKKFEANSTIEIKFPMYTACGPVFWNVEYQDGVDDNGDEIWKCNKTNQVSYDGAYNMDCTFAVAYRVAAIVEHSMTFENAIKSGYVKIRIVCADGSLQADNGKVAERETPLSSGGKYTAPFYFYAVESDVTSISFTLK